MQNVTFRRLCTLAALVPLPYAAQAAPSCAAIESFLAGKATGVRCFHSDDLRTTNPSTTPPDNSITTFAHGMPLPGLTNGLASFTPTKDRSVISNGPTATKAPVPGVQVDGWVANDTTKEARFLLRFPDDWNGKLVVAGASGTRSEYNGDFAWSDYVLPKGYAYASQNKGVLNVYLPNEKAADPLACRLNPSSPTWVHFYDNDPDKPFAQWTQYMLSTTVMAQGAIKATYNKSPRRTYAVGTSNGGYQVRRAVEAAPDLFDGGVDWEGTYIDASHANILIDLPPALKNFPAYRDSGYDPGSPAAKNIVAAGYPPDIVKRDASGAFVDSLWLHYWAEFWEVTACQWQKRFDPTYATYVTGLENYDYHSRLAVAGVFDAVNAAATTGKITKPLITVAGTMDALLPIRHQARAYEAAVDASRKRNNDRREAPYRLYEVQNGNHIESYIPLFPQLREIQPYAHKAFDLLVAHVEDNAQLPPSQCIPKDGDISTNLPASGNCAELYVP